MTKNTRRISKSFIHNFYKKRGNGTPNFMYSRRFEVETGDISSQYLTPQSSDCLQSAKPICFSMNPH